ncbi:MAG: hypothetical protein JW819_09065 [Candidatus Krumholzibacteriota bacterium]|nr:hypothetical protein [Candidatus Krumholzibacteriota bacterium]
MRLLLMVMTVLSIAQSASAATMSCDWSRWCETPVWCVVSITLANDAGTEVWIGHYDDQPQYAQLLRFDPVNCIATAWADLPEPGHVYGLARDGDSLWAVLSTGWIYKVDTNTWTTVVGFPAPGHDHDVHGAQGIAWDGQCLWHADGSLRQIYKLDPSTGEVLATLPAPGAEPAELEIVAGILYLGDHWGDSIYAIDSESGDVLGCCYAPWDVHARGVAARPDGRFWFLSGLYSEVYDYGIEWSTPMEDKTWGALKSMYR